MYKFKDLNYSADERRKRAERRNTTCHREPDWQSAADSTKKLACDSLSGSEESLVIRRQKRSSIVNNHHEKLKPPPKNNFVIELKSVKFPANLRFRDRILRHEIELETDIEEEKPKFVSKSSYIKTSRESEVTSSTKHYRPQGRGKHDD